MKPLPRVDMKSILFLWLLAAISLEVQGQNVYRKILLTRQAFSSDVAHITDDTAIRALRISSYLFNSKEFQDSILQLDFQYSNHCLDCGKNDHSRTERIKGAVILDSLFRESNVALSLKLTKVGKPPLFGKCFGLGYTCPDTYFITSYFKNIHCDMGKDLPFAYAYAVHLCHEYMHHVGYCHTDHSDDVAETVGWIAFHFISKWYKEGALTY